ncbi:hypothetical protein E4198_06185 [Streptomyces sp. RKND-216]|uniref:hypothetical protein n=1 Tax=Streptomyces sp. RKND-216 TaxID=2562581 RepID=UPI00109E10E1|nr:hypothetical protein [Streptomyces sp. RKND-216]THA24390.1 hypothetical protein E4198_06185 [Streptomyces sp. RKND-216]
MGTRTPNDRLRRAIHEAGCTYAEIARDVRSVAAESGGRPRTNSSAVAHWVAGTRPSAATARALTEALARRLGRALVPEQLGLHTPGYETSDGGAEAGGAGTAAGPGSPGDGSFATGGAGLGEDPVAALTRLTRDDLAGRTETVRAPYAVALAAVPPHRVEEVAARAGVVGTAAGGARAGAGDVTAARAMLELFTLADERHGGRHGASAVVQYLHSDVAAFCRARFRSETQRRQMLTTAGCLAYLAGWKAYDGNRPGLAQRYYLRALAFARAAGEPAHEAFVLRVMAHHGMECGRPEHTVQLMDAALERLGTRADPASASLYAATRARAFAVQGRRREAIAESSRALRLGEGADERTLPYWAALWGSSAACVRNHLGKAAAALGEPALAEAHFARAEWSPSGGGAQRRIAALSLAHTGAMQCRQGKLERACTTWGHALDLTEGVRSARLVGAVARMRTDLAPLRLRGARAALDFDARARDWLADVTTDGRSAPG